MARRTAGLASRAACVGAVAGLGLGALASGCRTDPRRVLEDPDLGRVVEIRSRREPARLEGSASLGRVLLLLRPSVYDDDDGLFLFDRASLRPAWRGVAVAASLAPADGTVAALAVSEHGEPRIEVRDVRAGDLRHVVKLDGRPPFFQLASAGPDRLAYADEKEVVVLSPRAGARAAAFPRPTRGVVVALAAAGDALAVVTRREVAVIDLRAAREPCVVTTTGAPWRPPAHLSGDGRYFAVQTDERAMVGEVASCRVVLEAPQRRSGGFLSGRAIWIAPAGRTLSYYDLEARRWILSEELPYAVALASADDGGDDLTLLSEEVRRPATGWLWSRLFGPANARLLWRHAVPRRLAARARSPIAPASAPRR